MGGTRARGQLRRIDVEDLRVASGTGGTGGGDHPLLRLQRDAGNQAVQSAVATIQRAPTEEEREQATAALYTMANNRARVPTRGNVALEIAKPTAVAGGAAGGFLGGNLGEAGNAGIATGVVGGAVLADAALTMRAGYSRRAAALKAGDKAGVSLGEGKMRQAGWTATGGAVGATTSGLRIGHAAGSAAGGLLTAASSLGIAGGIVTAADGMWKVYNAAGKLWNLGKQTIYTPKGESWKERVGNRLKWKAGVGTLKALLGGLGIAAGALAIVSNPVGWAVGLAAAIAGGAWAVTKIVAKISDYWQRRKKKKEIEQRDPDGSKRKQAKELADEVARELSVNAKTAGEMRGALQSGNAYNVQARLKAIAAMQATVGKADAAALPKATQDDKEQHDAVSLLAVLNIEPAEAKSPSGQERIEKKLSVAEMA